MRIIQDGDTILLIGSQHIYKVDILNKSIKCIYSILTTDGDVAADSDSGSTSDEEGDAKKKSKKYTTKLSLTWTGVGAVSDGYLMLCDSLKDLHLLSIEQEQAVFISKVRLEKAATVVIIHSPTKKDLKEKEENRVVYVADKFGEVWTCPLNDLLAKKNTLQAIAGHISLLTDMIVNDDFILTCDRDEKIRVTLRDRPWIIDQFLLEHKEYVSRMAILGVEHLVSGGGDKELMLWHWKPGMFANLKETDIEFKKQEEESRATLVERVTLDCTEDCNVDVIDMAVRGNTLSVILEGNSNILHFQLSNGHLRRLEDIKLDGIPVCIAYTSDGLLVGLEDGRLFIHQENNTIPQQLSTITDPIIKKCSHLRKTVHRLTD